MFRAVLGEVGIVEGVEELEKVVVLDKEVKIQSVEHLHFELDKLYVVDSPADLEGFVVVVDLVVEFGGQ